MQLVAYGAQDVYLTGSPKVTFFQAVYKKHTNFAMENIEQTVNGTASNSGRISVTIARNGDLVGEMYMELETTTNVSTTVDGVGGVGAGADTVWCAERAVEDIELTIGGQRIDKHYQRWWRVYSELYLDDAKKAQWGKMTSTFTGSDSNMTTGRGKVFLPLIFFFNRNPGLYLPLIALQYHEVRLDFDLGSEYNAYFGSTAPKIWANYVYLDTEERRRFAQKGHEYLIEQVQHTGTDTIGGSNGSTEEITKQVRLSYNHPVKELVWCYSNASTVGKTNALWNFCGPSQDDVTMTVDQSVGSNNTPVLGAGVSHQVRPGVCGGVPHMLVSNTAGRHQWVEEGIRASGGSGGSQAAFGPLKNFKLILNGQDRFKEQPGKYFNQIQSFNHHSGNPYPGIYSYSFALKPEEHQPTGTCNFSRIDNAQVQVVIKKGAFDGNPTQYMFATNYNVLRIQSGMGGLAFSN